MILKSSQLRSDPPLVPIVETTPDGRVTTRFTVMHEIIDETDYDYHTFNDIANDIEDARTGTVD